MTPDKRVIFEWTVHPPRKGGYRRIIFVATLVVVPYGLMKTLDSPVWAFFATAFLLGSTAAYWLPTTFTVTEDAVELKRWFWKRRKTFRELGRVERDPNGLFVSPFAQPSRLDGHRGMLLMEPPERENVLKYIEQRIAEARSGP
ncbi:MAG: hypothetical protein IPG71_02030 [bacterium]|nr:hypothetical protein [bacterium]